MELVILSLMLDVDMKVICFAIMTHYAIVAFRSESWTYGFMLNFWDFVILYYYKHLVLKCLMQIVQVFRFVYDDVTYIFGTLKDTSFMGKAQFRRATLSCDSYYYYCTMCFP